jgi:threonine/homoserine/homoserine lactone efflux protein
MILFNAWYYSFSPQLASYLGIHQTQRELFGYGLYPLIGLLYASYYTYVLVSPLNNEVAAVTAGLVAAAMIGFVYLAPPLYLAKRILRRKASLSSWLNPKHLLAWSAISSVAIGFSYSAGTELALGIAAASLLLSILTLGVIAGILVLKRVKFTYLAQQLAALNEVFKTLTISTVKYLNSGAAEE